MADAFASSHDSSLFETEGVQNPQHAIRDYGVTADSPLNTYSAGKPLDGTAQKWQGKRLDYIFFRDPHSTAEHTLVCTQSEVVLTGRVPGRSFSYSDHFGLEATVEIRPSSSRSPPQNIAKLPPELLHNGFAASGTASVRSVPMFVSPSSHAASQLQPGSLSIMISALTTAYSLARKRANKLLLGFVGCLAAALGLAVGSAWQTYSPVNPILIVVAVALGWGGTTLLYSGYVLAAIRIRGIVLTSVCDFASSYRLIYGNYECNMLVNAIEEMELLHSQQTGERF